MSKKKKKSNNWLILLDAFMLITFFITMMTHLIKEELSGLGIIILIISAVYVFIRIDLSDNTNSNFYD